MAVLFRDMACAALGAALALAVWLGAARLPRSLLSDEFGADGLPRGLAILLAAVSALIALRALWARRVAAAGVLHAEPMASHAKALGVAALGFAYVLAAPWLGYAPTAALLIFATAWYYGARPGATLAGISIAGAAALWLLFAKLLGSSMPAGAWTQLFR